MANRTGKQVVYGAAFLLILFFVGFLVWAKNFHTAPTCFDKKQNQNEEGVDCGGVCARVCTQNAKQIEQAGSVFYGFPDQEHLELMAKVQNPNSALAARSFSYVFRLYKEDGTYADIGGTASLYADDVSYVTEIRKKSEYGGFVPSQAAFLIGENVVWEKAEYFKKPQVAVRDKQVALLPGGIEVAGHIANEGTIGIPSVVLSAVFYGTLGQVVGVSRSELNEIAAGEVRAFSLFHPALSSLAPEATVVSAFPSRP
jgi:hypothetical protein